MIYDIRKDYRLCSDSGDSWGSCMGALFDICEWLYDKGESIPSEWRFKPSPLRGNPNFPAEYGGFGDYVLTDDVYSPDTVREFGKVLNRYADKLRVAGKDY